MHLDWRRQVTDKFGDDLRPTVPPALPLHTLAGMLLIGVLELLFYVHRHASARSAPGNLAFVT